MDLLTKQTAAVTQTFGPLQAEGTGGLGGLPCTGYIDT
jgi:hypothetical protein